MKAVRAMEPKRLIIAITGASGATYGVRMLQELKAHEDWETHLVVSQAGALMLTQELGMTRSDIESLADAVHNVRDVGAIIASGSFVTQGMVVAPCSMKTLASIAHGFGDNLVTRAADVILKERRRLILLTREAPLNLAHLRNMTSVTEMGGIIFPPVPAFYSHPHTLEDMVNHSVGRVFDLFDIPHSNLVSRWEGVQEELAPPGAHNKPG